MPLNLPKPGDEVLVRARVRNVHGTDPAKAWVTLYPEQHRDDDTYVFTAPVSEVLVLADAVWESNDGR